jgi:DUF917 family protein
MPLEISRYANARGVPFLRMLNDQDLADLVEGAAIFSAGGGGDPQVGLNIVDRLVEDRCPVRLIDPTEVPDEELVINFACVGATANVAYHSDAAVKTLRTLEEFLGKQAYAIIPVELGGSNTLAAVDVAARRGIPVVDADGAGRAVPEVHLKVYTLDNIPLAPMAVADLDAENVILIKQTSDAKGAERITRAMASEWNQMAYTARRVLTGKQVKISSVPNTLSTSIRIGTLLRKAVDPLKAILNETNGFWLFNGAVSSLERETKGGFTWTTLKIDSASKGDQAKMELKAKNEILIAYKDSKLAAIAPDIITPLNSDECKCVTVEKIKKGNKLAVIGIPAPAKWRTPRGLELWREVLKGSGIEERYVSIEKLGR